MKKTSVCYTLQIKLEGVIVIQCNPTYDDSTGRVQVTFFAVSADPRQELCIVFNNLFTRCQAESWRKCKATAYCASGFGFQLHFLF
jgi:hypothetical protein